MPRASIGGSRQRRKNVKARRAAKRVVKNMLETMSQKSKVSFARDLAFGQPIESAAFAKEFLGEDVSFEGVDPTAAVPYLCALNGLGPHLWFWQEGERDNALKLSMRMTYQPPAGRARSPADLDVAFKTSGVQSKRDKRLLWSVLKRMVPYANYREANAMTVLAVLLKLAARDQQIDVLMWGLGYLTALSQEGPDEKVLYCARCARRKVKYIVDPEARRCATDLCDALLNGTKKI